MERSPAAEGYVSYAEGILRIPLNQKFHNRIHKSTPLGPFPVSDQSIPSHPNTNVFEGVVLNSPRVTFHHMPIVTVTRRPISQSPKWRTDFCRLSVTAYSEFSELPSVSGGRPCYQQPEDAPYCYVRDSINLILLVFWFLCCRFY
jgi:hypothetical protein